MTSIEFAPLFYRHFLHAEQREGRVRIALMYSLAVLSCCASLRPRNLPKLHPLNGMRRGQLLNICLIVDIPVIVGELIYTF